MGFALKRNKAISKAFQERTIILCLQLTTMQLPTLALEAVRQARRLKPDPTPDLCNGLNSLGNQSLLEHWERLPYNGKDRSRIELLVTHPTGDMPTPRMVLSTTTKQYKRKISL